MCQKLNAPRQAVYCPISGINEKITAIKHRVNLRITSRTTEYSAQLDFLVLNKITGPLPLYPLNYNNFNHINKSIELADPYFYIPQDIDMLLGAEIYFEILKEETVVMVKELPPLRNTVLGYILCGRAPITNSEFQNVSLLCCDIDILNKQIQRFWLSEEIDGKNNLSLEEKATEAHYVKHIQRDTDTGRYMVSLPTKSNLSQLGDSFKTALIQFKYLERKLEENMELKTEYHRFINEYINLDHMQRVEHPSTKASYFMPHHAVFKDTSTTTKVRVVFNASSKSTSGLSLNNVLLTGPTIQADLFSLLIQFRQFKYGFVADITKMYRQILVNKSDRKLQQIIWRKSPEEEIGIYQLNTVTYGTTSAPFLAIRTLSQLASDECSTFPKASEILNNNFYVDDCISGSNNKNEALLLQQELISLLAKGGFELRKWASNCPALMSNSEFKTEEVVNVLGIPWHFKEDLLSFTLGKSSIPKSLTKRSVLSVLAQLFDPLGFYAPVIFTGKLIMQELWSTGEYSWDDNLRDPIATKWKIFLEQLIEVNFILAPRCVVIHEDLQDIELHGFADASEKGYGCCLYVRSINSNGLCQSNLLCAKSKVAPLKKYTIPRLELCAALLLAQLLQKVQSISKLKFTRTFLWSDSQITLCRIQSSPSKYSTFVANRISKIQDITPLHVWLYIPSNDNPADIVSRGLLPSQIQSNKLWWKGPLFLNDPTIPWPKTFKNANISNTDDEISMSKNSLVTIDKQNDIIERFSDFYKLLRITATILRFVNNCLPSKNQPCFDVINVSEINVAKSKLIKVVQADRYAAEIKELKKGNLVSNNSSIRRLNPFLDDFGTLRVGGRICHSSLPYDQIHPILLPSDHTFTKLLVKWEHNRNLHAGPQALLSYVRQHYWVVNGRNLCRKTVHDCIRCFRTKPRSNDQFMGQLPAERVQPTRPFTNVGVDFCGPFIVNYKIRSKVVSKVYICLYVCFATKAVHLELVSELSTKAFLASLRRFISRRGRCSNIYSDNATNFIGAKRELAELHRLFHNQCHQNEVLKFCSEEGMCWKTIPPRSPHFGGLWEAAIKSAKTHIKRVLGAHCCTFEELNTLITQVEACLNSRPLTAMSNDPSDLTSLTPAHFLIGEPLNAIPEPSLQHLDFNRLERYQRIHRIHTTYQYCLQMFWKRWSNEYLIELQQRRKWLGRSTKIENGMLVLLREENIPPMQWVMGRVIEVHPGDDEIVRVVTVKTMTGVYKRAVTRICILPIEV